MQLKSGVLPAVGFVTVADAFVNTVSAALTVIGATANRPSAIARVSRVEMSFLVLIRMINSSQLLNDK